MARPKGSKDLAPRATAARKQASAVGASGITPLDVLLTTMRRHWRAANAERDKNKKEDRFLTACNLAERAAPYCHARLATTNVNATVKRSITDLTDEELAAFGSEGGSDEGVASPPNRPH